MQWLSVLMLNILVNIIMLQQHIYEKYVFSDL